MNLFLDALGPGDFFVREFGWSIPVILVIIVVVVAAAIIVRRKKK